jgi:hypothetical protein
MNARAVIKMIKELPGREHMKVFAWADCQLNPVSDDSPMPQWHKDLLDERE